MLIIRNKKRGVKKMGKIILLLWCYLFFDYIIGNIKEEKKKNKEKGR